MRKLLGLLLAPVIIGAVSCSDGGSTNEANGDNQEKATKAKNGNHKMSDKKITDKFILPSPVEIASLVQKSGINYTEGVANPTEKVDFYTTNYTKALNLGVYGADLGLILVFDQTQDAINYFTTVKGLAEELNVLSAFPQSLLSRVEANLGNRDSLLTIATGSFAEVDKYLKENDRSSVSALMLAGGWIESVYIASKFGEDGNGEIRTRVGEQKLSLETLVEMISLYKNDGDGYAILYADLEDLKKSFAKVSITYTEGEAELNVKERKWESKRTSHVDISDEVYNEIAEKVKVIRERIIN